MHSAINMAKRQHVATMLPAELIWPYDCKRRCRDMERVATGPAVADEMTRHLREPYRSMVREQYAP